MKTLARHLFALIALFLCAPVFAQTSITPASHEVGAEVVPYQVLVNSTVAWTASANAAWVTLSRTSGSFDGNILVTAAANTTGADRTATITVDGATHTLTQRGTAIQELWGFGWDGYGQLGDNVLSQRVRPFHVVGDVQTVAAGGYQSLIVKTDGSLWAMGNNGSGELGDGTTTDRSSPVQILSGGVQAVAAGYWHSLIVKTDGSLWAMGDNTNGQLGDGTTTNRYSPVQILSGGVQAVAAGLVHSLILKTDGSLWAMGSNAAGQLGDGTTTDRHSPVQILAGGVQAVAAGWWHSLIVKTDGSLWAMGANWCGALGDGTWEPQRNSPVQILSGGVQTVAGGCMHSLIVKTDGSLWAMGLNADGELGDGTTTNQRSPVEIFSGGVQAISAGQSHSLILKTDGSLWAVGSNHFGQLGDGTTTDSHSPKQILPSGVQAVSAGQSHSLILKTDGSLWALGSDEYGQLGDGMTTERNAPVQTLSGGIQAVAASSSHSLILKTDGSLWAMGDNTYGELGDGTTTNRNAPVQILLGGVQAVAAGYYHSLIVKTDGSLWAMGGNGNGELGDGTTTDRHSPVQILSGGVQAVAAGLYHSLIVKTDGSLWAMGGNGAGELGDGTTTQRNSPVQILSGGVQGVAAGGWHSLIVKTDGSLWAMGDNGFGQLGDGTTTQRSTPVQIFSSGVQAVAAGTEFSLVLKTDGSLWAMGDNQAGQLGDGTTTQPNAPIQILSGGVEAVAAGDSHSLILKADGSLWAMGSNDYGQLGDGTTTQRIMPEPIAVNVQKIAAGAGYSLIVTSGNTALDAPQITVQPQSQTVTFGGTASFTAAASGAPGPTLQWQVSTDGGSTWNDLTNTAPYSGTTTGTLTITGATMSLNSHKYRCVATNSTGGSTPSNAATLTVSKALPVITWPAPAAITYPTPLSSKQLNATADALGTFVYSPAAGTVVGAGAHTLHATFTPTDTVNYTGAATTQVVTVNKAVAVITWPAPAPILYGTALSAAQLDATANVPGAFTYVPAAGTVLKGGTQTLKVYFAPTDSTDYAGTTATTTLIVNKAVPVITWAVPAPISYGTVLSATQLEATANVPGTFIYIPAAGTVLGGGAHTVHVYFTPTDRTDYTSATTTQVVTISKAVPVITWPAPAAITYGTALSATQLNAKASVPGVMTYVPAAGTVLKGGTQTLKVYFAPTDGTDYAGTTATQTLTVNKAVPVITWAAPASITYGTALSATQLNARSAVTGTFVYTPAAGTVLSAGAHTLHVTLTPNNTTNYTSATATQTLTVTPASGQAFLQKLFQDVLGREIDAGELSGFSAAMAGGESRAEVLGDLLGSAEYSRRQIDPAIRLYFAALARLPDYAGLRDCSNALHDGVFTLAGAADQLAGSAEFLQHYGALDNTQYVQQLFRNVLGREADAASLAGWVGQLDAGGSRGAVVAGLSESDEFKGDIADQVEILRLHYLLLKRMPTPAELQSWQDFLMGSDQTDNVTLTQSDLDYWTNCFTTLDDQMRDDLLADPGFGGGG